MRQRLYLRCRPYVPELPESCYLLSSFFFIIAYVLLPRPHDFFLYIIFLFSFLIYFFLDYFSFFFQRSSSSSRLFPKFDWCNYQNLK